MDFFSDEPVEAAPAPPPPSNNIFDFLWVL